MSFAEIPVFFACLSSLIIVCFIQHSIPKRQRRIRNQHGIRSETSLESLPTPRGPPPDPCFLHLDSFSGTVQYFYFCRVRFVCYETFFLEFSAAFDGQGLSPQLEFHIFVFDVIIKHINTAVTAGV